MIERTSDVRVGSTASARSPGLAGQVDSRIDRVSPQSVHPASVARAREESNWNEEIRVARPLGGGTHTVGSPKATAAAPDSKAAGSKIAHVDVGDRDGSARSGCEGVVQRAKRVRPAGDDKPTSSAGALAGAGWGGVEGWRSQDAEDTWRLEKELVDVRRELAQREGELAACLNREQESRALAETERVERRREMEAEIHRLRREMEVERECEQQAARSEMEREKVRGRVKLSMEK